MLRITSCIVLGHSTCGSIRGFGNLLQIDMMFSEVDEIDRDQLVSVAGRNPDGEAPVQLPIPRLRKLLSLADHFVALVADESKVTQALFIEDSSSIACHPTF